MTDRDQWRFERAYRDADQARIASVLSGESRYTIVWDDCLETLRWTPDCSVDAMVTDPPYGLSNHTVASWEPPVPEEGVAAPRQKNLFE